MEAGITTDPVTRSAICQESGLFSNVMSNLSTLVMDIGYLQSNDTLNK